MIGKLSRVLAIGAHPDDIELGSYGTLCRLAETAEIHTLIMADCKEDGWGGRREDESWKALGGMRPRILDFKHDDLIPSQRTVRALGEVVREIRPDLVLTHTRWDTHQDHRAVEEITLAACRRRPITLLGYHAISSTADFQSNLVVDITENFDRKLQAVACHTTQANQAYMQPEWLRQWHYEKMATSVGLKLVELFHVHLYS